MQYFRTEDRQYLCTEDGSLLVFDGQTMPGYLSIKDQIVITLESVSSLKIVYEKEEKSLSEFPAACVSAKGNQIEFRTIGGVGGLNTNVYQHYIRIYFRIDEENNSDYEDVLEDVADDVLAALAHNITLNGACRDSLPISGEWRYGDKETPTRVFEIVVQSTVDAIR